jgi:hypothetical protein
VSDALDDELVERVDSLGNSAMVRLLLSLQIGNAGPALR